MNKDIHVWFCISEWRLKKSSTIILSHPGAVNGSKGLAVRQERRYMIWV